MPSKLRQCACCFARIPARSMCEPCRLIRVRCTLVHGREGGNIHPPTHWWRSLRVTQLQARAEAGLPLFP